MIFCFRFIADTSYVSHWLVLGTIGLSWLGESHAHYNSSFEQVSHPLFWESIAPSSRLVGYTFFISLIFFQLFLRRAKTSCCNLPVQSSISPSLRSRQFVSFLILRSSKFIVISSSCIEAQDDTHNRGFCASAETPVTKVEAPQVADSGFGA